MENTKRKGPRVIGAIIVILIILFLLIEFLIREAQQFSPTSATNILLFSLQIIVLLLALILFFVLGRNLAKLYLERKQKVPGAHFKTKLMLFFIALSLIPTLLLFMFASDLINRNIEQWFQTPIEKILADTSSLSEGFYQSIEEITLHYAQQLSQRIQSQKLYDPKNRTPLMKFVSDKLKEYKVDEIIIFLDDVELFSFMNPDLPLQHYKNLNINIVKRAHLGEKLSTIEDMGIGEMIRRGVSFNIPDIGNLLVVAGKFLPQNYAQKINNITAYVQKYHQGKTNKDPVKTLYLMMLIFVTLLIVFAASWIGFHLAKGITVPIEKLAEATKEVSKGNLDVKVEDTASDEIGTFIESFNQMISDLKTSRHNIAQKTSELEGRRQYIETILDNITTGVITLDAENKITTINPSARSMLGLPKDNLVGKNFQEVLNQPKYSQIVHYIRNGIQNEHQVSDKEIKINLENQNVTLALTLSPLKKEDEEFSGMIIVLDNLTQLITAQKISAWKEMAQRVAHEIKNPLTPIQLSAERIIKRIKKDKNQSDNALEEGANTIVQEVRTIKSLIDEFSNFARMPKIQRQPTDFHKIIQQAITPFRGIFTEIKFITSLDEDVPSPVKVDPEQMRRLFINLIDNAIDAMNKQGEIKIQTSFNINRREIKIEVSDTGPGILEEDKAKLFLPDFSTKKKGTGLGLAIVSQIISEHNGTIHIEDNRPLGAKFIIQVPI
jgi:two-component system nitrogen regulation sensor histidine kinase NtrY